MIYSLNSFTRFFDGKFEQIKFSKLKLLRSKDVLVIRYPKSNTLSKDLLIFFVIYFFKIINKFKIVYIHHNELQYRYKLDKIKSYLYMQTAYFLSNKIYCINPFQSLVTKRKSNGFIYNSPIPFKLSDNYILKEEKIKNLSDYPIIMISTLKLTHQDLDIIKNYSKTNSIIINTTIHLDSTYHSNIIENKIYLGSYINKILLKKPIVFIPHINGSHPTLFYHAVYHKIPIITYNNEFNHIKNLVEIFNIGITVDKMNDIKKVYKNYNFYKSNFKILEEYLNLFSEKLDFNESF